MLSGVGASASVEHPETSKFSADDWYNAFLTTQLFDNSILSSSQANFWTHASQLGGIDLGIVPRLLDNEVSQHWDELLGMWSGLVSRLVPEKKMNLPVCSVLPFLFGTIPDNWSVFFLGGFCADVASAVAEPDAVDAGPRTLDNLTFAYDEDCRYPYQLFASQKSTSKKSHSSQAESWGVPFRFIPGQTESRRSSCWICARFEALGNREECAC
jgi:hypothetical protein